MGVIHAEIELLSTEDMGRARRHELDPDEIRHMNVNMLVDTGSHHLVINENIQEYMNYPLVRKLKAELANGVIGEYDLVGPVSFRYKGVLTSTNAVVMPGSAEPLLGVYAIEQLNLIIHPNTLTLEISDDPFPLKGVRNKAFIH